MVNFRDVGGLIAGVGSRTGHGVLFRGDAPRCEDSGEDHTRRACPSADPPVGWPPVLVLDLREPWEAPDGHPLADGSTRVLRIPLLGHPYHGDWRSLPSLTDLYVGALSRAGERIAEVLDVLTAARGPALVHCAAGKDRTGVLVAVLLRAAGVPRDVVLDEYLRTEHNVAALMRKLAWDMSELEDEERLHAQHIVGTCPSALRAVLDELDAAAGGVRGWLRARGVPGATIDAWTRQLVRCTE